MHRCYASARHTDSVICSRRVETMLRVALLVDGWNILKAADRLKRRINFGELPRAVTNANGNKSREIVFQRFYIGPVSGRNAPDRIARIADEVKAFGYEWIQCVTENTRLKTDVDSHIKMDMLQWAYCHSVDLIALCSGDGGYTEAIRRVKVLGLRVEVYTVKASNHIAPALERNVHAIPIHLQILKTAIVGENQACLPFC